mmetsp:Transcript_18214/g.43670  ORF Transcript_18214/g.43670 Transcript_18214/m.43670 type:complete len:579 (-) Transcript_18214:81-1817(-)
MVVHAGIQAALAFLVEGVRRHRQDGQLRALGQAADGTCGIQPVQDRHLNVHQHEGVVTVLDHVDRLLPVAGDVHDHAGAADQCHGHLLVDRVVLGQQHLARLCRGQRGQAFSGRVRARQRVGHRFVGLAGGGGLDVKLEPEAAAAAGLAVHADPAAHQFGQAAADGQAQPGAAVAARGGLVGLLEVLEQAILSIGIDADAAVLHLEAHRQALRGRRALAACRQAHKAAVGELDRIAGKVQQQLGDALRVTQQLDAAQGRRDIAFDLEALGGSALQGHVGDVVQHFVDRELNPLELHLAGLDLGEVEHVVDDAQQMLGRIGDLLQPLLLHRLDGVALGQVGQADDGVHRRADLVAHVGEEGALGQVRCLGGVRGIGELGRACRDEFLQVVAVALQFESIAPLARDVGQEAMPEHAAVGLQLGDGIAIQPALPAVGMRRAELLLPGAQAARRGEQALAHRHTVIGMDALEPGRRAVAELGAAQHEVFAHRFADVGKRKLAVHRQPQLVDHPRDGLGHAAQALDECTLGAELLLQRVAHVFQVAAEHPDLVLAPVLELGVEAALREVVRKAAELAQGSEQP